MLGTAFPEWPSFTTEEADAVRNTLVSNRVNYWTGSETREFECEFAGFTGADYAVALANGTLALDVALKAIGVKPGDEVVVTPRTFIASVSSVVLAGARPVFADVDPDSQNISADTISKVITPATKAIIVVHLAGMPADMDPIMALADSRGIYVIEDCAQAHGARYKGKSVGSIGHIGAWSFCQDKIMSTGGEGGMVTTSDKDLWSSMWSYKDHGKSYDAVYHKKHPPGFRWLHESFGTNWRMMEMQAVIGRIQLAKMKEWQAQRFDNAKRIWEVCRGIELLRVPELPADIEHAAYKCYVFVKRQQLPENWTRDKIVNEIAASGVPCYQGTCSEVYLEAAFDHTDDIRPEKRLPVARELGETSLMFLVHPGLEDTHINKTCEAIQSVFAQIEST